MKLLERNRVGFKTVSVGDILLISAVLLSMTIALFSKISSKSDGSEYEIYRNEALLKRASLVNDTFTIYTREYDSSLIAVTDSSLELLHSSCRAKICVHSREIKRTGEEIICLPFQLIFKISGERESDADIIAR